MATSPLAPIAIALALAAAPVAAQAPAAAAPATRRRRRATTKIADNVYVFRRGRVPVDVRRDAEGVIATDPIGYASKEAPAQYLAEIRKITPAPVKYVIYSHHHYDQSRAASRSRTPARPSSRTATRTGAWPRCSRPTS
jgi:hypothetical protein